MKSPDVLHGLALFVCNHIELGRLCGEEFADADADRILARLPQVTKETGLQALVVTLGASGSVYYDMATEERGFQPALPVKVVDTCGAGDAFFSGALAGLARGEKLAVAVVTGTEVAACTIQSAENNCVQLAEQLAQFRSK
jgi:sugar/nucleoside kinase (ribokinase family)